MEDKKYPIYNVTMKWVEDDVNNHREKYPATAKQSADLPPGRIYNSMSLYRMMREKTDVADIEAEQRGFFAEDERHQKRNPDQLEIEVEFLLEESWCMQWFCHWTFDDGQTDEEAVASFDRYVDRMEKYNRIHGSRESYGWRDVVCLMGAEERWRWHGEDADDPPPCRCKGCKKNKVIRIAH